MIYNLFSFFEKIWYPLAMLLWGICVLIRGFLGHSDPLHFAHYGPSQTAWFIPQASGCHRLSTAPPLSPPLCPQEQKDQSYSTVKTAATRISVNNLKPGTTYVFLIRPFSTPAPSSSLSSPPLSSSSSSSSMSSSSSSSSTSASSSTSSSSSSSSSSSPPPIDYGAYSAPLELQTLGECELLGLITPLSPLLFSTVFAKK